MNGNILALCDREEEYARHMSEFLKAHKEAPWKIHTYTDVESLKEFASATPIELLVVAENAYNDEVRKLPIFIYSMTKKKVKPDMYALSTLIFITILVLLILSNIITAKGEKRNKHSK